MQLMHKQCIFNIVTWRHLWLITINKLVFVFLVVKIFRYTVVMCLVFIVKCLKSCNSAVRSVARQDVYSQRMHSFIGRNAQYTVPLILGSLWTTCRLLTKGALGPIICTMSGLVLISLVLVWLLKYCCVKHQYIELPRFQVDELDKLIEFLCCK